MKLDLKKTVAIAVLASAMSVASQVGAHEDHDTPVNLPSIGPGASYSVTVHCPDNQYIVSGGVESIDQLNPTGPLVVTASYPSSTRTWTVEFTNRSGRPTAINEASAVITPLCRYRH